MKITNSYTLKQIVLVLSLLLFALGTVPYANEAFDLLLKASEATRHTAFQGIMTYQRNVFDNMWKAEFSIDHNPNQATKIVFLKPKIVEGNVLIFTNEGIWVTPLSDEIRDGVLQEMEPFPFHRILSNDETLFFQASFEKSHKDLLLQNYKIESDIHQQNDEDYQISILSVHQNRPSLKSHFDRKSNVQRGCKRFDYEGKLEESFTLTKLAIDPDFASYHFSINDLKKIHSFDKNKKKESTLPDFNVMGVNWVPKGFELLYSDAWNGRRGVTHHSLFTDGYAKISIFQRKLTSKEIEKSTKNKKEHDNCVVNRFKNSTSWVYFRNIDALRISSVGDLSPHYMGKILSKLDK